MKKQLLISLLFLLLVPLVCMGLELDYPSFGGIDLKSLADTEEGISINALAAWFYFFIVSISGFAAFVMLVWGGFQYLTSGINPSQISDAKDRIYSAILGLIIVLTSYLILQTINPELVALSPLGSL